MLIAADYALNAELEFLIVAATVREWTQAVLLNRSSAAGYARRDEAPFRWAVGDSIYALSGYSKSWRTLQSTDLTTAKYGFGTYEPVVAGSNPPGAPNFFEACDDRRPFSFGRCIGNRSHFPVPARRVSQTCSRRTARDDHWRDARTRALSAYRPAPESQSQPPHSDAMTPRQLSAKSGRIESSSTGAVTVYTRRRAGTSNPAEPKLAKRKNDNAMPCRRSAADRDQRLGCAESRDSTCAVGPGNKRNKNVLLVKSA